MTLTQQGENIKDLLVCPICIDNYQRPKALPCLHSFCEMCIQAHIESSLKKKSLTEDIFRCPLCRHEVCFPTEMPTETFVKTLKTNHLITNFQTCLDNRRKCVFCKTHPQEIAEFFCKGHSTSLCRTCKGNHAKCSNVKELSDALREAIGHETEIVAHLEILHSIMNQLNDKEAEIDKRSCSTEHSIRTFRKKLNERLDSIEHQLLSDLSERMEKDRKENRKDIIECKHVIGSLENSKETFRSDEPYINILIGGSKLEKEITEVGRKILRLSQERSTTYVKFCPNENIMKNSFLETNFGTLTCEDTNTNRNDQSTTQVHTEAPTSEGTSNPDTSSTSIPLTSTVVYLTNYSVDSFGQQIGSYTPQSSQNLEYPNMYNGGDNVPIVYTQTTPLTQTANTYLSQEQNSEETTQTWSYQNQEYAEAPQYQQMDGGNWDQPFYNALQSNCVVFDQNSRSFVQCGVDQVHNVQENTVYIQQNSHVASSIDHSNRFQGNHMQEMPVPGDTNYNIQANIVQAESTGPSYQTAWIDSNHQAHYELNGPILENNQATINASYATRVNGTAYQPYVSPDYIEGSMQNFPNSNTHSSHAQETRQMQMNSSVIGNQNVQIDNTFPTGITQGQMQMFHSGQQIGQMQQVYPTDDQRGQGLYVDKHQIVKPSGQKQAPSSGRMHINQPAEQNKESNAFPPSKQHDMLAAVPPYVHSEDTTFINKAGQQKDKMLDVSQKQSSSQNLDKISVSQGASMHTMFSSSSESKFKNRLHMHTSNPSCNNREFNDCPQIKSAYRNQGQKEHVAQNDQQEKQSKLRRPTSLNQYQSPVTDKRGSNWASLLKSKQEITRQSSGESLDSQSNLQLKSEVSENDITPMSKSRPSERITILKRDATQQPSKSLVKSETNKDERTVENDATKIKCNTKGHMFFPKRTGDSLSTMDNGQMSSPKQTGDSLSIRDTPGVTQCHFKGKKAGTKSSDGVHESVSASIEVNPNYQTEFDPKTPKDRQDCRITGAAFMPDGAIVLTDHDNGRLKLFDERFEFKSEMTFGSKPWDVASFNNHQIGVTFPEDCLVQFFQIKQCAVVGVKGNARIKSKCFGISTHGNLMAIAAHSGSTKAIYVINKANSKLISTWERPTSSVKAFSSVHFSANGDIIYVSDFERNSITALALNGGELFQVSNPSLHLLRGVVGIDQTILLATSETQTNECTEIGFETMNSGLRDLKIAATGADVIAYHPLSNKLLTVVSWKSEDNSKSCCRVYSV